MSILAVAKSAAQAADEGRLSQFALNELMQAMASTNFGGDMAKMLASPAGKEFLRPRQYSRLGAV
jgi:hypothetical protein